MKPETDLCENGDLYRKHPFSVSMKQVKEYICIDFHVTQWVLSKELHWALICKREILLHAMSPNFSKAS